MSAALLEFPLRKHSFPTTRVSQATEHCTVFPAVEREALALVLGLLPGLLGILLRQQSSNLPAAGLGQSMDWDMDISWPEPFLRCITTSSHLTILMILD